METMEKISIPKEIKTVAKTLAGAGYRAYLVGGCVRDMLIGVEPKDWDIATDATPEQIQKLFAGSVYENNFGTVGVKTGAKDAKLKVVEVTTFRVEGGYTDNRHPDAVRFAKTIEEDLARRDFTINAMALNLTNNKKLITKNSYKLSVMSDELLTDPYRGVEDLKNKVVRAVGEPQRRFEEDALRLMRAARFACELGFDIERETFAAARRHAGLLEAIAKERVRDELQKIIMAPRAASGIVMLEDLGLLRFVLPELREGIGCAQNKHHIYTVFEHNVRALNYTAEKRYPFEVRLAALFHDVGKPRSKRGEGPDATFHGHEMISARMAARALDRLRFSTDVVERVVHLIRYHMFYYSVGEVSAAGVRRFLARVGLEYLDDLLKVREADRIGSHVPKAFPYKLRHLLFMIDKVRHDPLHPKMLKVRGDDVMKLLDIPAGPRVGFILAALLEEVLDDPKRNTKKYLEPRVKKLGALDEQALERVARAARGKAEKAEDEIEEEMKQKHHVQ